MQLPEFIQLLRTIRRLTELRDLESLIAFALSKAKCLARASGGYLIVFKSGNLMPEPACFGPDGGRLDLPMEVVVRFADNKMSSQNGLAWFQEKDSVLQPLGFKARSVLYLPFHSRSGLQGGMVLGDPKTALEPDRAELLLSFGAHTSACLENVLLNRHLEEQIEHLLDHDDLVTKLPNRRLFRRVLIEAINHTQKPNLLAVLFIDLDNFKRVNRKLGYSTGDLLLFRMAQRMLDFAQTQRLDSLPARIGGDEFALMLTGLIKPQQAEDTAIKMLADLRKPIDLNGSDYVFTASVGIGLYPQDGQTAEEILLRASEAMYAAKDQGKDRFSFYSRLSERD